MTTLPPREAATAASIMSSANTNSNSTGPIRLGGDNPQLQEDSIRLAQRWVGDKITISGRGRGRLVVPKDNIKHNGVVAGVEGFGCTMPSSIFHVEAIGPDMPGVVSFRLCGTNLYLTNVMYGDEHRQNVATQLACVPGILADNIGTIVDYAVGRPTDESNFEGAGFNYSPMTVQKGPPNKLQMFYLEDDGIGMGVKSLFGTYWRYQWWNGTVSQSPHLLGDERWYFRRIRRLVERGRSCGSSSRMSLDDDDDSDDSDSESDNDSIEDESEGEGESDNEGTEDQSASEMDDL